MRKLVFLTVLIALVLPASADATFPGANGKIAFVRGGDIWTMDADGSNQVNITNSAVNESDPAWSPDGTKIAYVAPGPPSFGIYVANADGSGPFYTGNGVTPDRGPAWSPDGTRIAFLIQGAIAWMHPDGSDHVLLGDPNGIPDPIDWSPDGSALATSIGCFEKPMFNSGSLISRFDPVGPGGTFHNVSQTTNCNADTDLDFSDIAPSWSPNAGRILFTRDQNFGPTVPFGLYTIKPDGNDLQLLREDPSIGPSVWSPDGSKIAFMRNGRIEVMNSDNTNVTDVTDGFDPNWQPIPINAYPRPRGATPLRLSLVLAQKQCTSPNSTHGAPLAFGSCGPAELASQYLTTGTPDSNGRAARMNASLLANVLIGNPMTPADEADVKITAKLNDVSNKDLTDYTGTLHANLPVRITDKNNTPSPGGPGAATTQPFGYGFEIPCTATADASGSDCTLATTLDTLIPGTILESRRTVWQIGQVRVFDGGADGDGSTTADNTLFATQGLFVP